MSGNTRKGRKSPGTMRKYKDRPSSSDTSGQFLTKPETLSNQGSQEDGIALSGTDEDIVSNVQNNPN